MAQPTYVVIARMRNFLCDLRDIAHETGGDDICRDVIVTALRRDFSAEMLPPDAREALIGVVMDRFEKEKKSWEASDEYRRHMAET